MFPQKRPYHGIGTTAQTNQHIEATNTIRSWRAPGVTETTSGTIRNQSNIHIRPASVSIKAHFRVSQASTTSVKVHGGRWSRRIIDQQYTILLTTDGGTSGAYADVVTLTGITASGFIILSLDSAYDATTLTASYSASYPTGDAVILKRVIAIVTCAAGVITGIEQTFSGDIDDRLCIPDSKAESTTQHSIDYNSTLSAWEISGWHNAASAAMTNPGDLLVVWGVTNKDVKYCDASSVKSWLNIDASTDITNLATVVSAQINIWSVDHPETDPIFSLWKAGHGTHDTIGDTAPDQAAASSAHDAHMDARYWKQGGSKTTCYGNDIANSPTGATLINLTAPALDGADWQVSATTAATSGGAGSLKLQGGMYLAKNVYALTGYDTGASAGYSVGGVAGATIGSVVKGGIVTSAGNLKDFSQLKKGDMVLTF